MKNKLEEYDRIKLKEARKLIYKVYEYYWKPSDSLSNKLETIIKKLDHIINIK